VESCTEHAITFVVMRTIDANTNTKQTNRFEFDFRYYHPYTGSELRKPGVYVFKTADKDSFVYNHSISQIQIYRGKFLSQMLIRYSHGEEPNTIVKVKLPVSSDVLEFDVFFARIPKDGPASGADITLNWRSLDI
jgi:hypothetical protein